MAYRLALDVGTASLGLIALSLSEQMQPDDVAYSSLHIFSEPLLPAKSGGVGEPKKAARRLARQQRRLIERRARRLRRIAHLAPLLGLAPGAVQPDSGQDVHALRARAVDQRIELPGLLNVLLKLAKRRGYAGGFKVKKEDEEAGQVEGGIKHLQQLLHENGCKTLGKLLHQRFGDPDHAGRGPRESLKLKNIGLYAHRSMIEQEFDLIWDRQALHHEILNGKAAAYSVRGRVETLPIKQHFKEAVFHQRPLKSVAAMVGQCALEPTLPRAPAAQPAAQAFRIEKQLADLRWGMGRAQRTLTHEQRDHIRAMLQDPDQLNKDGQLTFGKIYKSLEKAGLRQEFPSQFNTDRFSRETLTGDKTSKVFDNLGMLAPWQALDSTTQLRVINLIANLGSPESVDADNWHERMQPAPKPEVVTFIDQWTEKGSFARLGKMGFDTGRAAYSIKGLKQLTTKMQEGNGCDEHTARDFHYKPKAPTGEMLMHLPAPASTGNVVVDVALRVVRHAVNQCLNAMGHPPSQIIVELSRDMALGLKARSKKEASIDKNRKARLYAKRQIESTIPGRTATSNDIFRYLLAQEQDFHCPYCSKRLELGDALDGNASNVDHILPRSLTQVKRLRSHLVIAHRACNAAKGDEVPMVAFKADADRISAVENCANILKRKKLFRKANFLLAESYESEKLNDKSLDDFTERQYVESSWIAKLTAQWMRDVCPNVSVSRGELTAQLRRAWKLETVIPQVRLETKIDPSSDAPDNHLPLFDDDQPPKPITRTDFERFRACWENHHGPEVERTDRRVDKRIDHRHHLIDALVIGLTDRSLYMNMARRYKERMEQRAAGVRHVKPWETPEPPLRNVREVALKLVREAKVKHRPDRYPAGAFFQGMAYAKKYTDDGKSRIARSLELIDLTDEKHSLDKARKGISDIVSSATRYIVSEEFEARIARGVSVETALTTPIPDPRYGTLIRQVQIYQRLGRGYANGEDAIRIKMPGRPYANGSHGEKHYLSDGYAYIALIKDENGAVVDAVSVRSADAPVFDMSRVARRIFRNDTVVDDHGDHHLVHQILADGTIRTAPLIESRTWIQLGSESGAKQFGKSAVMQLRVEE